MILSCLMLTSCAAESSGDTLTLIALNVGKGDCLLLQSGSSLYMIDTGLRENWGMVSSALKQMEVTRLDGVILTHTDNDHAGGAWPLAMSGIEIGGWYAPRYFSGVKEKKHPAVLAAALRGQSVNWLSAGDELPLDGGRLRVIGPQKLNEKENCNSLVLLAEAGGGRMLLTGDMEFPEEEDLLGTGSIPTCQVLKVGNHGENDATSEALVRQVKPEVAVISTNTVAEPDTPAKRVMEALRSARIYKTQDASVGVMVTLQAGKTNVQMLNTGELPPRQTAVALMDKSSKEDHIALVNQGAQPVDVTGWYILSERGGEMFVLPDLVLQAGQKVVIASLSSSEKGDLTWPETKVWHKNKADEAQLFDAYGRLIHAIE